MSSEELIPRMFVQLCTNIQFTITSFVYPTQLYTCYIFFLSSIYIHSMATSSKSKYFKHSAKNKENLFLSQRRAEWIKLILQSIKIHFPWNVPHWSLNVVFNMVFFTFTFYFLLIKKKNLRWEFGSHQLSPRQWATTMSEGVPENVKGPLLSHRAMNSTPSDLAESTILSLTPEDRTLLAIMCFIGSLTVSSFHSPQLRRSCFFFQKGQ